jgi:Zinc carboxypeptidase
MSTPARLALLAALLAAPAAAQATRTPRVAISWDRFYDYNGIVALCTQLAQANPALCRLEWLGESFEGRPMPLLVIANPATGAEMTKSAMWVDGNVHGNEVQGAEACVYLAWLLLERHGELPDITELVGERVFYICPMVNPDGRQGWFAEPNTPSSSRSGRAPRDDDGDGAFDEDPPNDLDGDGELLMMRLRVPAGTGTHRSAPDDPRRLENVPREKRRELGADFIMVGQEGVDDDGDGDINEDGPGAYDLNRNWPSGWQPDWIQFGAGRFPLSYPEPANIARFLLAHPNVAAVQSFHNSGGMILRGPGTRGRENLYPREDREVYDAIARDGEAMLPFYESMVIWEDLYEVHGGFVNWTAEGLGIISFTNEMWNDLQYFAETEETIQDFGGDTAKRLKFDDLLLFGETYVPWHAVEHPKYGVVEVGGFRKMTSRVPPPFMIEEMLHRNAAFCVFHASQMPRLAADPLRVDEAPGGAHYVTVELRNERWIPTRSGVAAAEHIGTPDLVTIAGDDLTVVAGGVGADRVDLTDFEPVEHEPARLKLERGIPGHGLVRLRWIVRGSGPFTVTLTTEKAGTLVVEGEL